MTDKSIIGSRLGGGTVDVEKGRLRFFAQATGQRDPIYIDESAARDAGHPTLPVPPTFLMCLNSEVSDIHQTLATLGMDLGRILHAEQAFEYHHMAYAGDTLTFETKVADVYEKKGGALQFAVNETRVTNQKGEHIADLRGTIVQRNA